MQLNILYQDKAKNAGDAAHRQGFSTKYWYKRLAAKCGNYFLNVPKQELKKARSNTTSLFCYYPLGSFGASIRF